MVLEEWDEEPEEKKEDGLRPKKHCPGAKCCVAIVERTPMDAQVTATQVHQKSSW